MASGAAEPKRRSFETLRVMPVQEHVLHVELNRPEKRNAMNIAFWREMVECFQDISQDPSCHAVVISGVGPIFTAGIDLVDMGNDFLTVDGEDTARKAWQLQQKIRAYQESFTVLEKCPKPVIAAVHGACIGGGGENYDDPHKTPASPVVHIRGLIDGVVEADLVEALQEFGPIR
ncbi:delta(3,5)-Delta(2,4)-dienoyl-CoA isomerase, mitochondrial-like [Meleagris gallopavo]|uniref:delta(3,5)-Delta(2,4)-dienoyl-CoA isomerase, mitochondrial-like n=1 Tax=Meleagris gallopavo TaxID=9103 RepID=UPI000549B4D5|nr:delta(3,5)-Delta(2,4)-dienoyl-CoA isomerase, mitochondrial-like [Meleagris gallopavo]